MLNRIYILSLSFFFLSCSKEIIQQKLTVDWTPSNAGSVSPPTNSFEKGAVVSMVATPVGKYIFKQWSGSLSGTNNPALITMDADKQVTAEFEEKPITPLVGNFYNGGIISKVYKLNTGDYQYSSNQNRPNFLIEKISMDDISFSTIKDLISKTQTTKIGNSNSFLLYNSGSNLYWTTISDSLAKNNGKKLDKLKDYTTLFYLTENKYMVERVNFASASSTNRISYDTEEAIINGIARFASQEFIINNNSPIPKIGDNYGVDPIYASNQAPPKIFFIDNTKKTFKIFQKSTFFGYVNFDILSKYVDKLPYNLGNGFRIPTLEELAIINTEFYLKGNLQFGNFITFSNSEDPNDNSKIQVYNFKDQKVFSQEKDIKYQNVSSPLLVKEIPF